MPIRELQIRVPYDTVKQRFCRALLGSRALAMRWAWTLQSATTDYQKGWKLAQWLRALAAPAADLGSGTHTRQLLFWPPWVPTCT